MPYFEKALKISSNSSGMNHPNTASSLNNLGVLLHAMGEYQAARPNLEKDISGVGKLRCDSHLMLPILIINAGIMQTDDRSAIIVK